MNNSSLYHPKFIAEDYHLKVVSHYFKEWTNLSMLCRTHSTIKVMYVHSGICRIELSGQSVCLKKGDMMLVDANVGHRLIVEKRASCRMLNVEFVFTPQNGIFPSVKQLAAENEPLRKMLNLKLAFLVLSDSDEIHHTLSSGD